MANEMQFRAAIAWISEERANSPQTRLIELIDRASFQFDLSVAQTDALNKKFMPRATQDK